MLGGREAGRQGGREWLREGGSEGRREGGTGGGTDGRREGGREGGREKEKTWIKITFFKCGLHPLLHSISVHVAVQVSPSDANVVECDM